MCCDMVVVVVLEGFSLSFSLPSSSLPSLICFSVLCGEKTNINSWMRSHQHWDYIGCLWVRRGLATARHLCILGSWSLLMWRPRSVLPKWGSPATSLVYSWTTIEPRQHWPRVCLALHHKVRETCSVCVKGMVLWDRQVCFPVAQSYNGQQPAPFTPWKTAAQEGWKQKSHPKCCSLTFTRRLLVCEQFQILHIFTSGITTNSSQIDYEYMTH